MITEYYKIEWREVMNNKINSPVTMRSNYKTITAPTQQLQEYAIQNYVMKMGILNYHKVTKEEYESNTQI